MTIISVEDAKAHMNIVGDDDDTLIAAKIEAAEAWAARFIGVELDDAETFPDGVPEPVKEGIRQLVAHLYENREATVPSIALTEVRPGLYDLLNPYRCWVF